MTQEELFAELREFANHNNSHRLGTPMHSGLDRPHSGWWFVPRGFNTAVDEDWSVLGEARTEPAPDVPNAFMLAACFALFSKFELESPFGFELLAMRDDDSSVARVVLFEDRGRILAAVKHPAPEEPIARELLLALQERIHGWEMVKPKPVPGADLYLANRALERLADFVVLWRRDRRFRVGHPSTTRQVYVAAWCCDGVERFRFDLEDPPAPAHCPWNPAVLLGVVENEDQLVEAVHAWLMRGGLPRPRGNAHATSNR